MDTAAHGSIGHAGCELVVDRILEQRETVSLNLIRKFSSAACMQSSKLWAECGFL